MCRCVRHVTCSVNVRKVVLESGPMHTLMMSVALFH